MNLTSNDESDQVDQNLRFTERINGVSTICRYTVFYAFQSSKSVTNSNKLDLLFCLDRYLLHQQKHLL